MLLLALLAVSGCASASTDDTEGGSTSDGSTSGSTTTGQPSSTGSSSTDPDSSSTSGGTTTDQSTSGSSGSSDSTESGSGSGSSSDSTGEPEVSPYVGDYEGTATMVCFAKMETTDAFEFTVAADGMLTGTVGSGDIAGTVDDEGSVTVPLEIKAFGSCVMDGIIDQAGNAGGTITCAELPCEGTWEASRVA